MSKQREREKQSCRRAMQRTLASLRRIMLPLTLKKSLNSGFVDYLTIGYQKRRWR
jgi:hypothetical protein